MAALLCFFSGLILSTMRQKNLQDFELRLIDVARIYSDEVSGNPDAGL
jgi:hypothetical protein